MLLPDEFRLTRHASDDVPPVLYAGVWREDGIFFRCDEPGFAATKVGRGPRMLPSGVFLRSAAGFTWNGPFTTEEVVRMFDQTPEEIPDPPTE